MAKGCERTVGPAVARPSAVMLKRPKTFPYPFASPVQLRLTRPDRASQNLGDLFMLVALHVMENEHRFVAFRQMIDGTLQVGAVEYSSKAQIKSADLIVGSTVSIIASKHLVERC